MYVHKLHITIISQNQKSDKRGTIIVSISQKWYWPPINSTTSGVAELKQIKLNSSYELYTKLKSKFFLCSTLIISAVAVSHMASNITADSNESAFFSDMPMVSQRWWPDSYSKQSAYTQKYCQNSFHCRGVSRIFQRGLQVRICGMFY